jgi:hypothetical protein
MLAKEPRLDMVRYLKKNSKPMKDNSRPAEIVTFKSPLSKKPRTQGTRPSKKNTDNGKKKNDNAGSEYLKTDYNECHHMNQAYVDYAEHADISYADNDGNNNEDSRQYYDTSEASDSQHIVAESATNRNVHLIWEECQSNKQPRRHRVPLFQIESELLQSLKAIENSSYTVDASDTSDVEIHLNKDLLMNREFPIADTFDTLRFPESNHLKLFIIIGKQIFEYI